MPVILLVRHAQASYGSADYDVLSETGRRQAMVLDAALAARGLAPDVVVAGPAVRHQDTALLCPRTIGRTPVDSDVRWDEYDTEAVLAGHASEPAQLTGGTDGNRLTSREFQRVLDAALAGWLADDEDYGAYAAGVRSALAAVAHRAGRGETALVFTSAGTIAAACCSVLGLPPASFVALNRVQVNTGVTKLVVGSQGTSLISFNEHGHLEEADRSLVTYR